MLSKTINTKNLIFLTIIGAPLYLVRFNFFGFPSNVLDFLLAITILFWIASSFREKNGFKKLSTPFIAPILLIILGALISTLVNQNYSAGFGILKSWFLLPIFFGIIAGIEAKKLNYSFKILEIIFFSSFLVAFISLFYLIFEKLTYDGRLSAFYLSPNHLAMFLAPGFLIGVLKLTLNSKRFNFFSLIPVATIAISLYFTHSYATWLSLFLSYLFSLAIIKNIFFKSIKIHNRESLALIILAISFIIFFQKDNSKFHNLVNFESRSSLSSRIMIWKSSLKMLENNWLLGIGPGNFQNKYLEYQKYFPPYLEWAVPQPHNLYLAFWLQSGLLGIIGFLWLIYSWLRKIFYRLNNKNERQKKLALILLAIIVYILIHGLVDTPYWKNDLSLIFWILIFL